MTKLVVHVYVIATAVLQLAIIASSQPLRINAKIIQTDTDICPSQEKRERAISELIDKYNVQTLITEVIPVCGDHPWQRVAYLNMSDPQQQCPSAWRLYDTDGIRACGGPITSSESCAGVPYPTGHKYQRICGRIIGYQKGSPGAFHSVHSSHQPTGLNDAYVDGVSVTYGSPRSHIWTLAAGVTEGSYQYGPGPDCPCSRDGAIPAPQFVGNNFYCESGNNIDEGISARIYTSDPLWDGQQCEGQCCVSEKSPPWFKVVLSQSTADNIEIRICGDEGTNNEDTPVELIEIYVS